MTALQSFVNLPNFCVLILYMHWSGGMADSTVEQCYFRNETTHPSTLEDSESYPDSIADCPRNENEKPHYCFVLWQNNTEGKVEVKMKGCFLSNHECSDESTCVGKTSKKGLMFCCCRAPLCNKEFWWEGSDSTSTTPSSIPAEKKTDFSVSPFLLTLLPVCVLALAFICFYWIYRRKKTPYFNEVPTFDTHGTPSTPNLGFRPIQLLEVKAKGRFGAVWKAQLKTETVAVKIFPVQDKQSWLSEQQIYKLPHMRHDNVLRFIGVENHKDALHNEFWLITAYHEFGSLCDFLKANTLTWTQLCRIAETMSRGLMHLHEEMAPTKTENYKPAIAHRDFKSKNVLLKSDMSACIADFGLALVFQLGKPCGDTHGQVGTRRYMAPEVLEGAINFSRDAFLRIDMYACGLVLWELASRCTSHDGTVGEYQLPFEEEVGQHPTLEDMQECVVHKKQRPALKASWKNHPGFQALCDTMEECWDHDAEARLSASCVMERIASQTRLASQPLLINDPNLGRSNEFP